MIKILELGPKREPQYFSAKCPFCGTKIVFEEKDIWFEIEGARVSCPNPGCGMKVFLNMYPIKADISYVSEEYYNNARSDTSKSGFQMLMEEKKKKDELNSLNQMCQDAKLEVPSK